MLLAGIILLASVAKRECPDDCVRQTCYKYNDAGTDRKRYECDCPGDNICRNPGYQMGTDAYNQFVAGILCMIFGGHGFFGAGGGAGLMMWGEQQARNRASNGGAAYPAVVNWICVLNRRRSSVSNTVYGISKYLGGFAIIIVLLKVFVWYVLY